MSSDEPDAAIVLFTGRGEFSFPQGSSERVRDRFPGPEGVELAKRVEALEAEFYTVKPRPDETLLQAANGAARTFAGHRPELRPKAVAAFRGRFAFDWK
jgi:hypothetical protein